MTHNTSHLYIGLLSGTSMDAVDAVLVDLGSTPINILAHHAHPLPESLRQSLFELCQPGHDEINRMGQLDIQVGKLFAKTTQELLKKANIPATAIKAIGSHGQTVRHHPDHEYPFTLQIGDPNTIVEATGITTVADFRRRDLAKGGQGAPLVPSFHNAVFRNDQESRVIVNIGGIANITYLPKEAEQPVIGFDTGPGNMLLDAWAHKHLNQPYDKDGAWAATGTPQTTLLNNLIADRYFHAMPPKSTGHEHFNLHWLSQRMSLPCLHPPENIQATLLELTAVTIAQAITSYAPDTQTVLVCGGGTHNTQLLRRLTELLAPCNVSTTEAFGIHPDWVEAVAFAWFAQQTLQGKTSNLPSVTGASAPAILGGIYLH